MRASRNLICRVVRLCTVLKFKYVAGLAVQLSANRSECRKANSLGLAGFEDGQILNGNAHRISKVTQAAFALGKHDIKIDDNGHCPDFIL
jgi:hypothetical protein